MQEKIGTARCSEDLFRKLITELIKRCHLSRIEIAERLSVHVKQPVSKRMIDDWTAGCKRRARFPACFVQAFCEVIENDELQRRLLSERLRRLLCLGESVEKLIDSQHWKKSKRPKR
jgi:hypothetical protein